MSDPLRSRQDRLLEPEDPAPVFRRDGQRDAGLVLVCEHAGQAVPASLGTLGLRPGDLDRHVGWDIGAAAVTRAIADRLDVPAVFQAYSRLVIDCNRPPKAHDAVPETSHGIAVPGNVGLTAYAHWQRVAEIFLPFHAAVDTLLDDPRCRVAVSVHSYERHLAGTDRPWDIGLLFRRDRKTAARLEVALRDRRPDLSIGMNAPYTIDDESDFFVPHHGEARGLAHVLIEIRNDHIRSAEGCDAWGGLLADCLTDLLAEGA